MSVLVPPKNPSDAAPSRAVEPRQAFVQREAPTVAQAPSRGAVARAGSETHRWFLVIGIPFVIGAAFFALAIGLGAQWPMVPAFILGPLLMIAGYIVLSLTSEANTASD
jgi:hypothetical protein